MLGSALLLGDRERLFKSGELNRLIERRAPAFARMSERAARWMEPGRTPFGEIIRTRRPGAVDWLHQASAPHDAHKKWLRYRKARIAASKLARQNAQGGARREDVGVDVSKDLESRVRTPSK
jgi:hypothetical protein